MALTAHKASSDQDWYVITDENDLTVRITTGLTVGEDDHGELKLNSSEPPARWLAFRIGENDELSLELEHDHFLMRVDGNNEFERHELESGTVINLPNNRLHISASLQRGENAGLEVEVRPVTADLLAYNEVLTSESDLPILLEPQEPNARHSESSTEEITYVNPGFGWRSPFSTEEMTEALGSQRCESHDLDAIPVARAAAAANEALTGNYQTDTPQTHRRTYETSETEPAAEVTAEFTAELSGPDALITPDLIIAEEPRPQRFDYHQAGLGTLGVVLLGILIVGLLSLMTNDPTPPSAADINIVSDRPTSNVPTVDALLRSVDSMLAIATPTDVSTYEFAIRSYETALRAEPGNPTAVAGLAKARLARERARQLRSPGLFTPNGTPPIAGAPVVAPATPTIVTPPPADTTLNTTRISDASASAVTTSPEALAETPILPPIETLYDFANADDWRVRRAYANLRIGQVIYPYRNSAVALARNLLMEQPEHPMALALLTLSADRLVQASQQTWNEGLEFEARNTLEEVLSFAPTHPEANRLWNEWVGAAPGTITPEFPVITNADNP